MLVWWFAKTSCHLTFTARIMYLYIYIHYYAFVTIKHNIFWLHTQG